jgi:hypothetical protein
MKHKRKPVRIEWLDACHHSPGDWMFEPPTELDVRVSTVGWLISESDETVLVAQSMDKEGLLTGVFSIPRRNVVSLIHLIGKSI